MQPAFVGRERELALLHETLSAAAAGSGQLLVLGGDPGIGKTRLASHFAAAAAERGAVVAWGHCGQHTESGAYGAWIELLRELLAGGDEPERRSQLGLGAADIATIVPDIRNRFRDIGQAPPIDPVSARLRLFGSVIDFLAAIANTQPLLLIFDDIHAADDASLRLLVELATRLRQQRVLCLVTFRTLEAGANPSLAHALENLSAQGQNLTLAALAPGHVVALLAQLWNSAATPAPAAAVAALCAGNPFYATQCAQLLRNPADRRAAALPGSLPNIVHDVLARRLAELSSPAKAMLSLAAVIGLRPDAELLRDAWQTLASNDDTPSTDLAAALAEAIQVGLLFAEPGGGNYVFAHALIHESVYGGLGSDQRLRLHRLLAEVLQASGSSDSDALAYHLQRGEPTSTRSLRAQLATARKAAEQLAYENAAAAYERMRLAVEHGADASACSVMLAEEDPGSGVASSADAVGELWLRIADLRWKAGDLGAAQAALAAAAARAHELRGDAQRDGAADADPRFAVALDLLTRAALGCGSGHADAPTGDIDRATVALIEEALRQVPPADSALRVRLLGRLAQQLYYDASSERRRDDLSRGALAMARRLGNPFAVAEALACRLWATNGPDGLQEHLRLGSELASMAQAAEMQEAIALTMVTQAADLMEVGDIVAADACIATHAEIAEALRQPMFRWHQMVLRALRAQMSGRFQEAEAQTLAALSLGKALRPDFEQISGAQLFVIYREVDRLSELQPLVERMAAACPNIPAWRAALANLHCHGGNEAMARRELLLLAQGGFATIPRNVHFLLSMALLTDTCVRLPEAPGAAALYDLLSPFAGRNVSTSGVLILGAVDRYLALLAARLDRLDKAAEHFEAAIAFNARQGAWPYVAHAQREYGTLLTQRGRAAKARRQELLNQALSTYEALAMRRCAEQVRSLLGWPLEASRAAAAIPPAANSIRYVDGLWRIEYGGQAVQLPDSNGMRYLVALLRDRTLRSAKLAQLTRRQSRRSPDTGVEQAERDRKSVRKALMLVVQTIRAAGHTTLATHLDEAIVTGNVCRYRPLTPTDWQM